MKKRTFGFVLIGIAGVYALIYHDVLSRSKASYLEAEKYMEWDRNPEKKKEYFDRQFEKEKAGLDSDLHNKKISPEEFKEKLEVFEFDRNFWRDESSLKYAYQWYKDTYELFSPPESKWVKLARIKAPEALNLWKQELREKKIPFQDTMVE